MNNQADFKTRFLINLAYYITVLGLLYFIIRYGIIMALPFLLAYLISATAEPLKGFLHVRLRFKLTFASVISVVFVFFIIGWLFVLLASSLIYQITKLMGSWPQFYDSFSHGLSNFTDRAIDIFHLLPPYVSAYIETSIDSFITTLPSAFSELTMPMLTFLTNVATTLPSLFVSALITLAASILISSNYVDLRKFIALQMPEHIHAMTLDIKSFFAMTVLRLLKAYAIICFITFVELSIGLTLLKINSALFIAAIIALFDILPIFGCGAVLVPWALLSVITGNFQMGVGIAVLYLIITSIRQVLEPKIVGDTIGLNPVAALIAIYIGLRFFGILGMFAIPLLLIVLKHMQERDYIKLWRTSDDMHNRG